MRKTILSILILLFTLVLVSCKSNNVFDFRLDDSYKEFITLGTSADYPPYEYLGYENNKLTVLGVDIEIAKEIAKASEKNLRVINKDFDLLLEDLKAGKVDFVLSGMNPNDERRKVVDFSDVYYTTSNVVIVNKNNQNNYLTIEDLNKPNIRVGTQLGSVQQGIQEEIFNNAQPFVIKDVNQLMMQLNDNRIDAVILETPVAESFVKKYNNLHLTNLYVGEEDGFAVAVAKGNQELLTLVNGVINQLINDDKINDYIYDESLKDHEIEKSVPFSFLLNTDYLLILLKGIIMTIVLSLLAVGLGSVLGFFVTIGRLNSNKIISNISKWYTEIIRGTPLLVQVLLIYSFFRLPVILFLGIDLSSFIPGVIALLINSSAYTSEIFRGGIQSIDAGQTEAALSLGLSNKVVMRKIILPQAIKNIIPSLGNEFVSMIKETSIFMYLGVAELMYAAAIIQTNTYQIKEVYIVVALLYLVLTLSTSKLMSMYQKKLGVSDAK